MGLSRYICRMHTRISFFHKGWGASRAVILGGSLDIPDIVAYLSDLVQL